MKQRKYVCVKCNKDNCNGVERKGLMKQLKCSKCGRVVINLEKGSSFAHGIVLFCACCTHKKTTDDEFVANFFGKTMSMRYNEK